MRVFMMRQTVGLGIWPGQDGLAAHDKNVADGSLAEVGGGGESS
jgi:hypothetical protein